jgi:phosphopantothenoylcysteine decarboxylase / phosphopantothenate---cysteine ligase
MLSGKRIVLGVTGSIAAYKAALLVRLLIKAGAEVKVVMTEKAMDFITPLTLSTLSQHPVFCKPFDEKTGAWTSHVDLALWADLLVIAPATANTLSRMASGQADNLLLATYLSAKCPVLFAPAMDLDMFQHPSTQQNIRTLQSYGNIMIEPTVGDLASGLTGAGRMEEPVEILSHITEVLKKKAALKGKKALVSAGPTFEAIDPVRFIGNHSSGKMGFAIAEELHNVGAIVTLVTGPVHLSCNPSINRINVISAAEMHNVCTKQWAETDLAVMSAAVADFTPVAASSSKIKKEELLSAPLIELKPTDDILKQLGAAKRPDQVLIGFALETDRELENARKKLDSKNLDMIVLNSLKDEGAGFGHDTNKVSMLFRDGRIESFPLKQKKELAVDICREIVKLATKIQVS